MTRQIILLLSLALCACATHSTLVPAPTGPVALVPKEEAELRHIVRLWWPAKIAKDSAFFRRLLATEFVQRPSSLHQGVAYKDVFIAQVMRRHPCGGRITVQERDGSYHIIGSEAAVNVMLTLWFGDPAGPPTETVMFLLFTRRDRRWQVLELHEAFNQVPAGYSPYFAWTRPKKDEQGRPTGPPFAHSLPDCDDTVRKWPLSNQRLLPTARFRFWPSVLESSGTPRSRSAMRSMRASVKGRLAPR